MQDSARDQPDANGYFASVDAYASKASDSFAACAAPTLLPWLNWQMPHLKAVGTRCLKNGRDGGHSDELAHNRIRQR